ncbi:helix-turn-helix domain-containing protein [Pseudoalteromonas sp. MMG024]|uniref:helix-turn-helix domain-containing protein n=1 Tax=Pseudoalteromonas sp. MMG024 TaxID=2909980 RepID=UPI001F2EBCF4|nr:helix-turn-helix domain-containing protein [Pseudoalteromonas sp. MMG024]MCF6457423.1 helix-turn-helix transcriptional regulator [Pseudoalteromonas sp. MMG024]
MKYLRLKRNWSQEQLAQFSGLNVRTIQRVERGDKVGSETLKSLAAVYEITVSELLELINKETQPAKTSQKTAQENVTTEQLNNAKEKVKLIKYFYGLCTFLTVVFIFFMLPNYNGGENFGSLVAVFLSFAVMIAGFAFYVFEPFGEKWEQKKLSQIVEGDEHKNGTNTK